MLKNRYIPGAYPPRHSDPHLGGDAKFSGRGRGRVRAALTAGEKSINDIAPPNLRSITWSTKQIVEGHTFSIRAKKIIEGKSGGDGRGRRRAEIQTCPADWQIELAGSQVHVIPSIWISVCPVKMANMQRKHRESYRGKLGGKVLRKWRTLELQRGGHPWK